MRSLALGCLWLLTACGPAQFQQEKLKDGSIKVTCELSMDECVRQAQDLCRNQRFRILEGASETRLRDAPPFEKAYHTSRLHLACTDGGAPALISFDKPAADASKPTTPIASCSSGETRMCVGPGACRGGQTCLADRSGFGTCDCGPAAASAAPVAPVAQPATLPSPETSPTTPTP